MNSPGALLTLPAIAPEDLVIRGVDIEQKLAPWAIACPIEAGTSGTATITVSLVEQERGELLRQMREFFKRDPKTGVRRMEKWNVLRLHDTNYILRELQRTTAGFDLVFYDEASEDMKRYVGPIKWARDRFTRAQGIKGLANEAGVQSYIPDRDAKQPIADLGRQDRETLRDGRVARFDIVYPAHFIDQASGRTRFTAAQVRMIAESVGLPPIAFEQIAHGESGYYPGVFQRDPGDGNVGYGLWQITPHAWGGSGVLLKKLKELGGIAGMRNPINNARMAKFMFDMSGLSPWYGTRYLTEEGRQEAAKTPRGDGTDNSTSGTVDRAYVERFEFSIAARENYWDGSERLLNVVQWRRFAIFNYLVVASDTTLAQADPYTFSLDDDWIDDPGMWTVTSGRRIDELPIRGRLQAIVPPGTHIAITDDDPCYGTWIVRNFKRDLLDPECEVEINLGRPLAPLPEPAASVRQIKDRDTSTELKKGKFTTKGGAKGIVDQVADYASKYGTYVGSNYRPGSTTTDGNVSDHSEDNANRAARDIGVSGINLLTGPPSPKLDMACVAIGAAFGRTYKRGQTVIDTFSWNGFRVQIIWRTPLYGGHMGHIHVGARKL